MTDKCTSKRCRSMPMHISLLQRRISRHPSRSATLKLMHRNAESYPQSSHGCLLGLSLPYLLRVSGTECSQRRTKDIGKVQSSQRPVSYKINRHVSRIPDKGAYFIGSELFTVGMRLRKIAMHHHAVCYGRRDACASHNRTSREEEELPKGLVP